MTMSRPQPGRTMYNLPSSHDTPPLLWSASHILSTCCPLRSGGDPSYVNKGGQKCLFSATLCSSSISHNNPTFGIRIQYFCELSTPLRFLGTPPTKTKVVKHVCTIQLCVTCPNRAFVRKLQDATKRKWNQKQQRKYIKENRTHEQAYVMIIHMWGDSGVISICVAALY